MISSPSNEVPSWAFMRCAIHFLKGPYPSVVEYCRAYMRTDKVKLEIELTQ